MLLNFVFLQSVLCTPLLLINRFQCISDGLLTIFHNLATKLCHNPEGTAIFQIKEKLTIPILFV